MARLLNGKASQELKRIEKDAPWHPIQIRMSWLVLTSLDSCLPKNPKSQIHLNTWSPFDCTVLLAPHQALIYLRSPLKPLLLKSFECIGYFDFEHRLADDSALIIDTQTHISTCPREKWIPHHQVTIFIRFWNLCCEQGCGEELLRSPSSRPGQSRIPCPVHQQSWNEALY